jgi:hypothetical protein
MTPSITEQHVELFSLNGFLAIVVRHKERQRDNEASPRSPPIHFSAKKDPSLFFLPSVGDRFGVISCGLLRFGGMKISEKLTASFSLRWASSINNLFTPSW